LTWTDDLVEQSFRNLVWFFQDELREIENGTPPLNVPSLTEGTIKRLHKYSVLKVSHHLVGGYKAVLTEKAKKEMEELDEV